MKTTTELKLVETLATSVAGEDILGGDYLAILTQTYEVPAYLWDCTALHADDVIRLTLIPNDAGHPLKVLAVCLPFVYVKTYNGAMETLDVRRMRLVRLDKGAAKAVWKELRVKQSV